MWNLENLQMNLFAKPKQRYKHREKIQIPRREEGGMN